MIGHQQILDLRAGGMKPAGIFVMDQPAGPNAEQDLEIGALPSVFVGGDVPEQSDVRWAFGCVVHLVASDASRAVRWVDALLQVKPTMVIQSGTDEVHTWRP